MGKTKSFWHWHVQLLCDQEWWPSALKMSLLSAKDIQTDTLCVQPQMIKLAGFNTLISPFLYSPSRSTQWKVLQQLTEYEQILIHQVFLVDIAWWPNLAMSLQVSYTVCLHQSMKLNSSFVLQKSTLQFTSCSQKEVVILLINKGIKLTIYHLIAPPYLSQKWCALVFLKIHQLDIDVTFQNSNE